MEIKIPTFRFSQREVRISDLAFFLTLSFIAVLTIFLFLTLFYFLMQRSLPVFDKFDLQFFTNSEWSPAKETYGVLAFAFGTVTSSLIALIISVPISVATSVFLTELAPKFIANFFRITLEMLAAIPSVIYGLWGIFILAPFIKEYIQPFLSQIFPWLPFFQGPPFGIGLFSAGLILAIMITPTITTITVEVFKSIPNLYREGAKALGATTWETIKLSVLKPGSAGILAAVILGLGRAMGETMAVAMVIGNRADISSSLFSPAATMSSVIANEYAEASSDLHVSALTAVGLTLLIVSLIVNGTARIVIWRMNRVNR